jgi:hypothetical protein
VSAFSESSFDSEQLVDKGSPLSASELESRLNETELVFFLAGLSVSLVPETFVGAMVMGGTQSFESTMSASLYFLGCGAMGGTLDSLKKTYV